MREPRILPAARRYWSNLAARDGAFSATCQLLTSLWEFLLDSTPTRSKSRFGDADYDWDHRVNTTSGAVNWRNRLLGVFHSPYQPTQPELFREMMESLMASAPINLADFRFIDIGSGKGRVLLMASDFPFRRIVGVELLPALHAVAEENIAAYTSETQKCFSLQSICADATTVGFPEDPLLIYLFNPLPEAGLRQMLENLQKSLQATPRPAFVLYHNPELEPVLAASGFLHKIAGTQQYSIFAAR